MIDHTAKTLSLLKKLCFSRSGAWLEKGTTTEFDSWPFSKDTQYFEQSPALGCPQGETKVLSARNRLALAIFRSTKLSREC